MEDDVVQLVWATYNSAMASESGRDPNVAFHRAVEEVQRRRPLLTPDEAHGVVTQILAGEDVGEVH